MVGIHLLLIHKLILIFGFFLLEIWIFGLVYAWLYDKNPHHFVFNADIAKGQREVSRTNWEKKLSQLCRVHALVLELDKALVRGDVKILPESAPSEVVLLSGYRYKFTFELGYSAHPTSILEIFDENNRLLETYAELTILAVPNDVRSFLAFMPGYIDRLKEHCAVVEKRLAGTQDEVPQIWGISDFLYFSVVIQTTIGLGDILPNSTLIRKLVILQTLLGYVTLIVFLNLVLGSNH